MKNKILVVGIILLFIGVGFQPVLSIEINNSNEIIEKEEDCNCEDFDIEIFESLDEDLTKLRFYAKLSLTLSKDYPEITENIKNLFNGISRLEITDTRLKTYSMNDDNTLICMILYFYAGILVGIGLKIEQIFSQVQGTYPILTIVVGVIIGALFDMAFNLFEARNRLNCDFPPR